jgi:hypothetical protein
LIPKQIGGLGELGELFSLLRVYKKRCFYIAVNLE